MIPYYRLSYKSITFGQPMRLLEAIKKRDSINESYFKNVTIVRCEKGDR